MDNRGNINLPSVFLAVLFLTLGFYGYTKYVKTIPIRSTQIETPIGNTANPTSNSEFDWKIPEIPRNIEWEISDKESGGQVNDRDIFLDNTNKTPGNFEDIIYGEIRSPGKLYEANMQSNTNSGYSTNVSFIEELSKNGWVYSIDYGDYTLTGVAADGAYGGAYGLIKINEDLIRTVVVTHNTTGKMTTDESGFPYLECPCNTYRSIFVGNPVNFASYLNTLK